MSHYFGRNNPMIIICLFFFLAGALAMASADSYFNPLVELSNREDLVKMAGYGEEPLSTVTVTGTILCFTCSDGQTQLHPHPISGASVAVLCGSGGKRKANWARGLTDEIGDFLIDLPSHLHAIPNLERVCSVKVLQLPKDSACQPAFTGKHQSITLSSMGDGSRSYTARSIQLTPKPLGQCKYARGNKKEI